MTYKIRIRHKVPNKIFPLSLRYDDTSLNLPVIGIELTDSFQIIELTGWYIPGHIDVSKIKIEGTYNEGDKVYVVGNIDFIDAVETVDENVPIVGSVRLEMRDVYVGIDGEVIDNRPNINVEIVGTVIHELQDEYVRIEGEVRENINDVNVEIVGTVIDNTTDVNVEIVGTVSEGEPVWYSLDFNINNGSADENDYIYETLFDGILKLTWYNNEDMDESHKISKKYMYLNGLLDVYENDVWFKLEAPDEFMTINPSSGHLVKDWPFTEINLTTNIYRIHVNNDGMDDTDIEVTWYKESTFENILHTSSYTVDHLVYSGYNEVWAKVRTYIDGYQEASVHITKDEYVKYVSLNKSEYVYNVSINPSDADVTIEWFKDENCEIPLTESDGEWDGSYTFTTSLSNVWIRITSDDYSEQIVAIDGNVNEDITVVLNDTVTLSAMALPSTYNETDYTQTHLYQEYSYFPIVISNDKHQLLDYTVSVTSEHKVNYTKKGRDFSVCSSQINIGNEYSIFIATRGAYGVSSHDMVDTTGTFTIHSEKSEDINVKVIASGNSEHYSAVRFNEYSGVYCNVDIIPYSTNNTNIDLEFIGADDGAAVIDGNTIKYYTGDYNEGKDYPSKEITYECLNYYRYNNGSGIYTIHKTIAFDSESMFQNITYELARKYSHLRFSILPNNLDRLKFGVLSLYPTDCRYFVIQETENIRFVYSNVNTQYNNGRYAITTIDLSNIGDSFNINLVQRSDDFKIYLIGQDIKNRITVTSFYGNEVSLTETSHYSTNTKLTYKFKSTQKYESDGMRHDGFIITIN